MWNGRFPAAPDRHRKGLTPGGTYIQGRRASAEIARTLTIFAFGLGSDCELMRYMRLRLAIWLSVGSFLAAILGCGLGPSDGGSTQTPTPAGPAGTPTPTATALATGSVAGYVYVNPTQAQGRQQVGQFFIVSATQDSDGEVPANTRVEVGTTGLYCDLNAQGYYSISHVPIGVHSLRVMQSASGEPLVQFFDNVLVLPNQTTFGTEPPAGATLNLSSPSGTQIDVGDSLSLQVELRTGDATLVSGFPDFVWDSSDESVLTVNSSGQAYGQGPGTATISVSAGPLRATIDVTVTGEQPATPTTVGLQLSVTQTAEDGGVALSSFVLSPVGDNTLDVPSESNFLVNSGGPPSIVGVQGVSGSESGAVESSSDITLSSGVDNQITLLPGGSGVATVAEPRGGQLRIQRLRLSFPTSVASALLPASLVLRLPIEGQSAAGGSAEATGLPDGTTVRVELVTQDNQASASGTSTDGTAQVSGFDDVPMSILLSLNVLFSSS